LPTSLAHAKRAVSDPRQCLFYRAHETTVGLMQPDLKLRFKVGIGLVNEISLWATRCWHPSLSVALSGRQLALFLQQQSVVSLQVGWAHEGSLWVRRCLWPGFYTHTNPPVRDPRPY